MSDQVETVVPGARGKAKAYSSMMAASGGMILKGTGRNAKFIYREGPLKGQTKAQGLVTFDTEWGQTSGARKDMYAARAGADEMLSPSEKAGLPGGQATGQQGTPYEGPGVHVSGRGTGSNPVPAKEAEPAPGSDAAREKAPGTAGAAMAEAGAMENQSSAQSNATTGKSPENSTSNGRGAKAQKRREQDQSQPGKPDPAATPAARPDRMVSDRQPSELGRMAGKVFNGIRGVFGMEQKPEAPARVPDGKEEGTPVRINRLTGLPFGYHPGDALPTGADPPQYAGPRTPGFQDQVGKNGWQNKDGVFHKADNMVDGNIVRGGVVAPSDIKKPTSHWTEDRNKTPAQLAQQREVSRQYDEVQARQNKAAAAELSATQARKDEKWAASPSAERSAINVSMGGSGATGAGGNYQKDDVGPGGGKIVGVRPAGGTGKPYAPPGAPMDQKRRKPIGRR